MIGPVAAVVVRKSLGTKGFHRVEKRDHEMYFYHLDGLRTSYWVKLSHGAKELRTDEIKINAKNLKTRGEDLYKIIKCDYDVEETRNVVRAALQEQR